MVRETRHLWVGNLPDNIREDRLREHFKRYGRVQSVKVLARVAGGGAAVAAAAEAGGACAAVAFMDIKSAAKAHNADKVLDARTYTTEYYEPPTVPPTPSAGSSPAGSGYSASSGSVSSAGRYQDAARHANTTPTVEDGGSVAAAVGSAALAGGAAAAAAGAAAGSVSTWRGTNDSADRGEYRRLPHYRRAGYPSHHRRYPTGESSAPSTPGAEVGSNSGGTRRRRRSCSGSSRSSSSSPAPSSSSRASTPTGTNHRGQAQWAGRPLAICVRNLPARSSDSSLKEGLYHEYKKHGKVAWVKVVGNNAERYAVVRFKKPTDVEKALEVSQDKLFFGCKISVAPHQGSGADLDDGEPARHYETDLDENHPKATRTLFIGNLEKDVTSQMLRDKLKHFGRILEIDVKKQSGGAGYAFCQYATISSVVEAIRAMDGEYIGGSRVKLGFGKSMATTCVWIDGLTEHTEKQDAFYEQLEKHSGAAAVERLAGEHTPRYSRHDSLRYETVGGSGSCRSRGGSYGRTPRYHLEHDIDYSRYRVYDEFGASSPAELDTLIPAPAYEERALQSVVVASPRRRTQRHHRRRSRDSDPDDPRRSKESSRRRADGRLRSRSGSLSGSRRRHNSEAERRRHRRRRDESGAESRADTPLRDELPEGPAPADPRRPPPHRERQVMTLLLPKFAESYLTRSAPPPTGAPASPPRAPSVSSSSGGSAPHSPSLEERIRSLDEKYEKWSGSRAAAAEAAERGRLRHRLLDIDIKEVKPSDLAKSLLSKRSVFDEDTERLEGAAALEKRAGSPSGSPRTRCPPVAPRALQYPFPTHPPAETELRVPVDGVPHFLARTPSLDTVKSDFSGSFECGDVSADNSRTIEAPNRTESLSISDKPRPADVDSKREPSTPESLRARSTSLDKSQEPTDEMCLDKTDRDRTNHDRDPRREADRRRREASTEPSDDKPAVVEKQLLAEGDYVDKDTKKEIELTKEEQMNSDIREQLKIDTMEDSESSRDPRLLIQRDLRVSLERDPRMSLDRRLSAEIIKSEDVNIKAASTEITREEPKCKSEGEASLSDKDDKIQPKPAANSTEIKVEVTMCREKQDSENAERELEEKDKEQERLQKYEAEKEMAESERTDKEKVEKRIDGEMEETDRMEKERAEREKDERMQKEKAEKEQLERENEEKEKSERFQREKLEQQKLNDDAEKEKQKQELEKLNAEKDKLKSEQEKVKFEKEKSDKETLKCERETEKVESKLKHDKDNDGKKDRTDNIKKRESECTEIDIFSCVNKSRKDDKSKHDRHKKDNPDSKREPKKDKEESKSRDVSRKSSRDESCREIHRKDSSDSTTSRTSHDSTKYKDTDNFDVKDKDIARHSSKHGQHNKHGHEHNHKPKSERDSHRNSEKDSHRNSDIKKNESEKYPHEKVKDISRSNSENLIKDKHENHIEKQRHYSLDSHNVDNKRKERLTSSSSLPSNIGQKRRLSSQDVLDYMVEESKKAKIEQKALERRDSKELKHSEKPKVPKLNKGHFAKLLESKVKDDKKNQVKPPDDKIDEWKSSFLKDNKADHDKSKCEKKPTKNANEDLGSTAEQKIENEGRQEMLSPLEFLATLQLRSSEEDEREKALRKEKEEKKRIQQLQQIQELQMKNDAFLNENKNKEEKKLKSEERKKEAVREKRMSTERKSREEKVEYKKRQHKTGHSSDTSDSDEPKKHSIFDIVDDGPTYISMYDKVKARSCKNMQKQEEEKRQEKIKAKFSQLKQSRAKREEKKRSTSWDEDSDSENEQKKWSVDSSSEDERHARNHHQDSLTGFDVLNNIANISGYYNDSTNDDDTRGKMSRKTSRSRIVSDTSDDDSLRRQIKAKMANHVDIKKEAASDNDLSSSEYTMKKHVKKDHKAKITNHVNVKMETSSDNETSMPDYCVKKQIKKEHIKTKFEVKKEDVSDNEMANSEFLMKKPMKKDLFHGSDHHQENDDKIGKSLVSLFSDNMDDKKPLKNLTVNDNHVKINCNDFSSEGEINNKLVGIEFRKKHKKKQKKQKSSLSEDESKSTDYSEQSLSLGGEIKHRRNSEKANKHSNRKEKRKDKNRESVDSEDFRDDKSRHKKGKKFTENSFESKTDVVTNHIRRDEKMENIFGPLSDDSDGQPTSSNTTRQNNFNLDLSTTMSNDKINFMSKNADDIMSRDKEKDESKRRKERRRKEKRYITREDEESLDVDAAGKAIEASLFADSVPENDNQNTKLEPTDITSKTEQDVFRFSDCDDSREMARINNEIRQNEKARREVKEKKKKKKKSKDERQNRHYHYDKYDIKMVSDSHHAKLAEAESKKDVKSALQSPSLPTLTDSPPPLLYADSTGEVKDDDATQKPIEKTKDRIDNDKHEFSALTLMSYRNDVGSMSENAVKSISELDEHKSEVKPAISVMTDEKNEEKPRAVISQEETEDAVAALLGESFGGNDSYASCFDEVDDSSTAQTANSSMETDNIPEVDAEEMRQAVQNLNASELEMKPDTPLSENDLQIDTDNEEQEDSQHDSPEKIIPVKAPTAATTVLEKRVSEATVLPILNAIKSNAIAKIVAIPGYGNATVVRPNLTQRTVNISPTKREFQQITSSATPVISTSWTLSGNKLQEPHFTNTNPNLTNNRIESPTKMTANLIQLKPSIPQGMIPISPQPRGVMGSQTRASHPFVINQVIRPGNAANLQPPTIKIPEHHVVYQKQGVVISPRMGNDPRIQSPKSSPHSDMSSPRMTIVSPTPGMGLPSPTLQQRSPGPTLQQRSPGHLTVVRMQQPPLSPIQNMHHPHGATVRPMVSPNRPGSVLVQSQTSNHINRLPVVPVLTPMPKPTHPGNVLQQPKPNPNFHHQQQTSTELRKSEPRSVQDLSDKTKFVCLSSLQPTTNPTMMAQNRLIMQNANLHMANRLLFANSQSSMQFKPEVSATDIQNKGTYQSPIIHISTVNQLGNGSGHTGNKPVISIGQDQYNAGRPHVSNIINPANSQRLLTTVAMTSVIQGDSTKPQTSSVLTMAPMRPANMMSRFDKPASVSVTTSTLSNVVMTPVMVKTNIPQENYVRDARSFERVKQEQHQQQQKPSLVTVFYDEDKRAHQPVITPNSTGSSQKDMSSPTVKVSTPSGVDVAKCETDFEELLKDTTNEIKVTKPPDFLSKSNVEVKVGGVEETQPKKDASVDEKVSINDKNNETKMNELNEKTTATVGTKEDVRSEDEIEKNHEETWSAPELNIDSVIKEVDDLCNSQDVQCNDILNVDMKMPEGITTEINGPLVPDSLKPIESQADQFEESNERHRSNLSKRGGRNARGKKPDKQADRVQTRQIAKPARGGTAVAKRGGRGGKAKMEKKVKSGNNSGLTLSGDVYDFHDDSGDETQASAQNKSEARPRLILTIKGPLSNAPTNVSTTSVTTTSTTTIVNESPTNEKLCVQQPTNKEEKSEDFLAPAPNTNTRKSRRLQAKDGNRNTVDDVIDDVVKNSSAQSKAGIVKDGNGRRPTRQAATKAQEKAGSDVRKSPRGGKRARDRSSSETSIDSSDEKTLKKDETAPPEPKICKQSANVVSEKVEEESIPAVIVNSEAATSISVNPPVITTTASVPLPAVPPTPTPIMKPPKKMILSEISAKLGPNFDRVPARSNNSVMPKEPDLTANTASVISGGEKQSELEMRPQPMMGPMSMNLHEKMAEMAEAKMAAPPGRGAVPGADEAELRVGSPALPHRPPPLHHRAAPILIRAGDNEALEACRASPAAAGAAGLPGRVYRAVDASLPRGAHHPPPHPHTPHVAHTSLPSGSPQGSITGDGMYPHFSQHHYQVYQQHFRATQQDMRGVSSPYHRTAREPEGSEALTPALELRRPPPSARVPRPAHSPLSAERAVPARRSPPPAHAGRASLSRLPSALPPLGPPGPPHASQVPREADSLQMLLTRYPVMWQGLLALKNDGAAVQMHFVHGNPGVAQHTLPRHVDGSTPPLRIAQRMRLEPVQLEAVHRKMQMENEHCMLLALPCGRDHMDVLQQSTNLTAGFITYLQRKQAAGIVNVAPPGHHQAMYTVHIFPSCEFANENLNRIAPDLLHRVADIAHLLIVIATV